jgi:hypothetical protein
MGQAPRGEDSRIIERQVRKKLGPETDREQRRLAKQSIVGNGFARVLGYIAEFVGDAQGIDFLSSRTIAGSLAQRNPKED